MIGLLHSVTGRLVVGFALVSLPALALELGAHLLLVKRR